MEARKEYFTLERQGPKPGCCDKGSTCRACLLFLGILLLIAGLVTLLCFLIMLSAEPGPTVETPCGPIHGSYHARAGAFVYKGIPYAKPPVGELRWKDSEELKSVPEEEGGEGAKCWEGTLQARTTPSQCIHHHGEPGTNSSTVSGDEDCLYLNIYVPDLEFSDSHKEREEEKKAEEEAEKKSSSTPAPGQTTSTPTPGQPEAAAQTQAEEGKNSSSPSSSSSSSSSPLPVMFFIHGENMADEFMPPIKLAEELGAIIVVPQFRLSALGFLVLDNFDPDQMGNYGIGDIIQALKWVQSNIKAFGGDPKKVTVFGSGLGGTAVWGLLTSPTARDLFSRAWVMTGSTNIRTDLAKAASQNQYVWEASGCEDAECLRELSAENITKIYEAGRVNNPYYGLPNIDERSSPQMVMFGNLKNPLEEYRSSGTGISDIPILVGSAAQSIQVNPAPGEDLKSWDLETLTTQLDSHLEDFGEETAKISLDLYNMTGKDIEFKYSTMVSDIRFVCQQEAMAFAASQHMAKPVYRYVMRIGPSSGAKVKGSDYTATHAFQGWDMLALFDSLGGFLEGGVTEEDENLRKTLIDAAHSLANEGKLPEWKEFPDNVGLLSNDELVFSSRRYHQDMCRYWMEDLALNKAYTATQ